MHFNMIGETQMKQIHNIIDEFGGERKQLLMSKIKNLLRHHDRIMKNEINNRLADIL